MLTWKNMIEKYDPSIVKEQQIFQEPNEFSMYIETIAAEKNQTCLEALVDYIEDRDIEDLESLSEIISPSLKDKLYQNFVDLGMIRSQNTLLDFLVK